ncbi:hypothetical protein MMC14_007826 [Varicellaria rhodocarpa]|nr:hypothetical protein [Varicellaria rhodocarpa]
MSDIFIRQDFSPSCPSGGTWYACGTGSTFLGCCNSEPCVNGCPAGNLEPASFNSSWYGNFSDQQCPTGSQWYTCEFTKPPFMGCCKSSPCTDGCPTGDLTAAFLDSNPELAGQFSPSPALSVASVTTSSSLSSSTSTITSASTSSAATPSTTSEGIVPVGSVGQPVTQHSTSIGVIAGAAIGGAVILAILLLLFYYRRRAALYRKKIKERRDGPAQNLFGYNDGVGTEIRHHDLKKDSATGRDPFHNFLFQALSCDL